MILAILAIHSMPAFSQSLENRRSYFWDTEAVSQFLSSPILLTVLFAGCGIAVLMTICSFATESYLMRKNLSNSMTDDDQSASSDAALLRSDRPKPACRVLQHFANLLPPAKQ